LGGPEGSPVGEEIEGLQKGGLSGTVRPPKEVDVPVKGPMPFPKKAEIFRF